MHRLLTGDSAAIPPSVGNVDKLRSPRKYWPVVPVVIVGLMFIIQDGLKLGGLAKGDLG